MVAFVELQLFGQSLITFLGRCIMSEKFLFRIIVILLYGSISLIVVQDISANDNAPRTKSDHAGAMPDAEREVILAEIIELDEIRRQAMREGDCEKLVTFFDDRFSFYVNGREFPSLDAIVEGCRQIPRPFPPDEIIIDEFYLLSEKAVYNLIVLEFEPRREEFGDLAREVITRIWNKTDQGWRIVHMHVSINEVPDE